VHASAAAGLTACAGQHPPAGHDTIGICSLQRCDIVHDAFCMCEKIRTRTSVLYITQCVAQSDSSLVKTCMPQDIPHAIVYVAGMSRNVAELMQGFQLLKCQMVSLVFATQSNKGLCGLPEAVDLAAGVA